VVVHHEPPIEMDAPFTATTLETQTEFLRNLARSLLGDEHRAEDLAQSVQARILEDAPETLRSPRGWLATVLKRRGSNLLRDEATRLHAERGAAREELAPDPARALEHLEMQERLARAVRALDEKYREVIDLRYYEGLAPSVIAQRLGVPVSTVKTRLQRAIERLREVLDGTCDGDRDVWCAALAPLIGARWVPGQGAVSLSAPVVLGGWIVSAKLLMVMVVVALGVGGGASWSGSGEIASSGVQAEQPAVTKGAIPEGVQAEPNTIASRTVEAGQRQAIDGDERGNLAAVPCDWMLAGTARDSAGAPISDAEVSLRFAKPLAWAVTREPILTDENGQYRFALRRPEFPVSRRSMHDLTIAGSAHASGQRRGSGELSLPAWIPGSATPITLDIVLEFRPVVRGRILNDRGEFVHDASVVLSDGEGVGLWTSRTDREGRYSLRNAKNVQRVFVSAWHAAEGLVCSTPQVLDGGDHVMEELTLQGGAAIFGTLRFPNGRPIVGLKVSCARSEGIAEGDLDWWWFKHGAELRLPIQEQTGMSAGEAYTDDEGRFRIDGLLSGSYVLSMRDKPLLGDEPPPIGEAITGEFFEKSLALHHLRVLVQDEQGLPLPGAHVSIKVGLAGVHTSATGPEAMVEEWVAEMDWVCSARFEGARSVQHVATVGEHDYETDVTLTLDFTVGEGRIQLGVQDESGAAVEDACINLEEEHGGQRYRAYSNLSCDSEGLSASVACGSYVYKVRTEYFDRGKGFCFETEGVVVVREGQVTPLDVTLPLGGRLQIRCETEDGGDSRINLRAAPVETGAELEGMALMTPVGTKTTFGPMQSGDVSVSRVLEPGAWSIVLRAEGYEDFQTVVRIRKGEHTPLDVLMRRP